MNKKTLGFGIVFIASLLLFMLLTLLVKVVDVRQWSWTKEMIGFYAINTKFAYLASEENKLLDLASDGLLVLAILVIAVYGVLGFIQLIKRKSLFKVDIDIIIFGIGLVLSLLVYLLFELLKFNYRPILVDGILESSYPSSHIILVSFVGLVAPYLFSKRTKNHDLAVLSYAFGGICIFVTFVGRVFSNQHWLTDGIAGLLLGVSLAFLVFAAIEFLNYKKSLKQEK